MLCTAGEVPRKGLKCPGGENSLGNVVVFLRVVAFTKLVFAVEYK